MEEFPALDGCLAVLVSIVKEGVQGFDTSGTVDTGMEWIVVILVVLALVASFVLVVGWCEAIGCSISVDDSAGLSEYGATLVYSYPLALPGQRHVTS